MCNYPFVKGAEPGTFQVMAAVTEKDIMDMATALVSKRYEKGQALGSPKDTRQYLILKMADLEHEVLGLIYMDNRHCILGTEILFKGTIDGASIYPREIIKQTLSFNAAAVILFHNHPSGVAEPSSADQRITNRIVKALETIDVRVIDHMVVGGTEVVSFAERGLL